MWHCLYAYRIVGDNVDGLSKLVSYGSIFILFLFLLYFFGCFRPNVKGVAFGEEIIIFWNYSTDIYAERTFINLLTSQQSFI